LSQEYVIKTVNLFVPWYLTVQDDWEEPGRKDVKPQNLMKGMKKDETRYINCC
jgi:hypothetical protein